MEEADMRGPPVNDAKFPNPQLLNKGAFNYLITKLLFPKSQLTATFPKVRVHPNTPLVLKA
jgi:hypothetical protein